LLFLTVSRLIDALAKLMGLSLQWFVGKGGGRVLDDAIVKTGCIMEIKVKI